MANLITEIFVSVDGLEFTKLDLHKDESIIMKYTQKDLQDISKIFAPYSQNFTFPATPKNRRAFGFFGDTTVIKVNTEKKYFCKIYSSGQLYQNGYLIISDLSYKNNRPIDFTGSFANNITNLKDRIGEDTINDLGSFLLNWNPSKAYQLVQGTESFTIDGINYLYYVPFVSNSRVWSYNTNPLTPALDNIIYRDTTSPTSENLVKSAELRPAVSFRTIFDLLVKRYGLEVIMPLYNRPEFNRLFVWCNNEKFSNDNFITVPIVTAFGSIYYYDVNHYFGIPTPRKYLPTANLSDGSIKIQILSSDTDWIKHVTIGISLQGVFINGTISETPYVILNIRRKGTNEIVGTIRTELEADTFNCVLSINDTYFISNELEFYVDLKFGQSTNWNNTIFTTEFAYNDSGTYGTFGYHSTINNAIPISDGSKVDLIKSLPNIKVIDLLNSFIKSFNISIYDTSPNDNKLYFLTPEDVNTNALVYSKATLDYTPYTDISESKKSVPSDYNYYNFKHTTSKYRSNVDFKKQTGNEYGQIFYPNIKPINPKEFKVETNFSIIPPRLVNGSENIITAYGFTDGTPNVLDSGESRYTPNWNELTLFYNNGAVSTLTEPIGFQNKPIGGALINSPIYNYIVSLPYLVDGSSFSFSILKEFNIEYPINLFSKYYQAQIIRYLDLNVLSQEYSLTLPASELYLNEATTIQGGGATPVGFRLQNDIIIGETKFSILDAPIDITTGKVKMTLLNY